MYLMVIACAFLMLLILSPPELETRCHFQEVWEETRLCCVFTTYNLNVTTLSDDDSLLSCESLQSWILSNNGTFSNANKSDNLENQTMEKLSCYHTQICRTQETLWTEHENIQKSLVQNCDQI